MAAKKRRRRGLNGVDDWKRVMGSSYGCEDAYRLVRGSADGTVCRIRTTGRKAAWTWGVYDDAARNKKGIAKVLGKGKAHSLPEAALKAERAMAKSRR
jgi:hypothetical protein